jgi:hypothetical protein
VNNQFHHHHSPPPQAKYSGTSFLYFISIQFALPYVITECISLCSFNTHRKKQLQQQSVHHHLLLPIAPLTFVVVRLQPTRKKAKPVFFVGYVISGGEGRLWRIQCMRRHGEAINQFIFPSEDDIDMYSYDEIVKVLPGPKIERSVHHFPIGEFDEFSSALR